MNNWVSLHNHTMFSLFDGCGRISDFVQYANVLRFKSLAITDHGTCAGFIDFQNLCIQYNIKPIFGIECYISNLNMNLKSLTDEEKQILGDNYKEELNKRTKRYHLLLLAKNDIGLKTLYKLTTDSNSYGFYIKPRIDYEYLKNNHEGLICTTACMLSKLGQYILNNDELNIKYEIEFLYSLFKDDLFLELEANSMNEQQIINKKLIELSKKYNIKTIITNDVHYINEKYKKSHNVLLKLNSKGSFEFSAEDLYLMDYVTFFNHIKKNHEYIEDDELHKILNNTNEIANMCNAIIDVKTKKEPSYINDKNIDNISYITQLIKNNIKKRGIDNFDAQIKQIYINRLKYEFKIIKDKGYIDYFLIVWDFINYAKNNNILIGPGRGSVGGSLLAWILGITEVNPMKHKLKFERFANPERNKSPDIDTDIEDIKRDELRQYLINKWGNQCVVPIIAYSRYSANSLFRDVCKYFGLDFKIYNNIAKTIESTEQEYKKLKTFSKNLEENQKLNKFINDLGLKGKEITEIIGNLEGQIKNTSVAAAGTVISNKPLYELMPLRKLGDNDLITEWEGIKLVSSGFLKMDLLGLKTLTILHDCIKMIGKDINWLYNINLTDDNIYNYFRQGKTLAIFQFEGNSITDILKKIKPKNINDLSDCSALYRPGPITHGLLNSYIKRKNGEEEINNSHNIMNDIFKDTYGICIYQEQIIDLFNKLGLSYGEADLLRFAIDENKFDIVNKYFKKIIDKKIYSENELNIIFDDIKSRSGYSFNLSHALQYAIVSYYCQYLKYYYPKEFSLANLNNNIDNQDKINLYIKMFEDELNKKIYYGNINDFSIMFEIINDTISFGYASIKYLSINNLTKIKEIKENKDFSSFEDFLNRTKKINSKIINILISAGMFDNIKVFDNSIVILKRMQLLKYYELYLNNKKAKDIFDISFINNNNIFNIKNNVQLIAKEIEIGMQKTCIKILKYIYNTKYINLKREYLNKRMHDYKLSDKKIGNIIIGFVINIEERKTRKNSFDIILLDKEMTMHNVIIFNSSLKLNDLILAELEHSEYKKKMLNGFINIKYE